MSNLPIQPPQFPGITRFLVFCGVAAMLSLVITQPAWGENNKNKNAPKPSQTTILDVHRENLRKDMHKVEEPKDKNISGWLPKNWQDDSAWADLNVNYDLVKGKDDTFDDDFLRARIKDWRSGQAQIRIDLPKSGEELIYEVVFEARSPTFNDLVVNLRQRRAPYRSYARDRVSLTPEWRTYSDRWIIREEQQDLSLMLDLGRQGIVDLRKLSLRRLNEEALRRDLVKEAKKSPDHPNLLRQTRFPLGLPAGWTISPELAMPDDVEIQPDPAVPAPAEVAKVAGKLSPLRVDSTPLIGPNPANVPPPQAHHVQMFSAPFAVINPDEKYTASLYIRGEIHGGALEIYADGQRIARSGIGVNPDEDWKRVSVTFDPQATGELYVFSLQGRGRFWIDGLMVSPGAEPTDFALQQQSELHLSLGQVPNVVFGIDPVEVTVHTVNAPDNAVMKARVYDLYGNNRGLEPLALVSNRLIISVPAFSNTPYGSARVEAWVEDRQGKRLSPYAELLFTRLREPHFWRQDAPESAFGAHFYPVHRQIQAAKAVGVNWTRLHGPGAQISAWDKVQPDKDTWVWRDDLVARYRDGNVLMLGVWFNTPQWAIANPPDNNARETAEFLPRDLNLFAQYAARTALHYGKDIQHWQLWQDPGGFTLFERYDAKQKWRDRFIRHKDPAAVYAQLMRRTWETLQRDAPFAQIVGINAGWNSATREWTAKMAELNVPGFSDVTGLSTYWGADRGEFVDPAGEFYARFENDFLQPLRQTYGRVPDPIWVTQASPTFDVDDLGFYRRTVNAEVEPDAGTLVALADRIPRFTVNLLSQGVQRLFLDSMANSRFLGDKTGQPFLTLVTEDLALNPGAGAHSAMAYFLEKRRFVMVQEMLPQVFVYFFENTEEATTVAVIIPTDLSDEYHLDLNNKKPACAAYDLFGNPLKHGPRRERTTTYIEIPQPTRDAYPHLQKILTARK